MSRYLSNGVSCRGSCRPKLPWAGQQGGQAGLGPAWNREGLQVSIHSRVTTFQSVDEIRLHRFSHGWCYLLLPYKLFKGQCYQWEKQPVSSVTTHLVPAAATWSQSIVTMCSCSPASHHLAGNLSPSEGRVDGGQCQAGSSHSAGTGKED